MPAPADHSRSCGCGLKSARAWRGFDIGGVAAVAGARSVEAMETQRRFEAWVAAGRAGEMNWLKREDAAGQMLRANLLHAMPWARSGGGVRGELQLGCAAVDRR